MSTLIENLTKAQHDATFCRDSLTEANKGAPAVVSLHLLPMINKAALLAAEIEGILVALEADETEPASTTAEAYDYE